MSKNTLHPIIDGRRQSWHETSKETGHHYRPGYYFPDSDFQPIIRDPLPPPLAQPDHVTRAKSFPTTTGFFHDHKFPIGVYDTIKHPLAPSSRKVNYVKDLHEKLGKGGWRRPLTMGNQSTEYSEYGTQPPLRDTKQFEEVFDKQPFLLHDHHHDGPTKLGEGSSHDPKHAGEPFYVKDKGILRELDPYLSTTHKDHRRWNPSEGQGYPKKDVATYWACEEYPKAWGHGPQKNPLPKSSVPRERGPMRDTLVFKSATRIPRIPKRDIPVPHMGLRTLYNESFQRPTHLNMKWNYNCPVDTPYILPDPSTKSIYTAPKAYKTEYMNIGSRRPVTINC